MSVDSTGTLVQSRSMHLFRHSILLIAAIAAVSPSSAQEMRSITPGQFHALTVPGGMVRLRANTDYYAEVYSYEGLDRSGEFREFDAGDYFDLNASIELKYGLTDRFEIGLGLPFVSSTLEKDNADRSLLPSKTESRGLGNVTLHGGYGLVWNGDSDYLLFQVDLGLPTDSRGSEMFSFGGNVSAGVEFEHYWDRFGVTAGFLAESYAEDGFDFNEWDYTGVAGLNLDITQEFFLGTRAGFSSDRTNVEVFGEYVFSQRSSVEIFAGKDISGDTDARFLGISFNLLFDK
ncbi:MAG: hypothetical protein KDN22_24990 [Verrucomicrobiae bacterium]|nr:hypothetical protein [Verrucomicrobiae bacterium]